MQHSSTLYFHYEAIGLGTLLKIAVMVVAVVAIAGGIFVWFKRRRDR